MERGAGLIILDATAENDRAFRMRSRIERVLDWLGRADSATVQHPGTLRLRVLHLVASGDLEYFAAWRRL